MTPGRQIFSTMVFKQRMPRYIFPVEGELLVFSSYLYKQTVLKNYLLSVTYNQAKTLSHRNHLSLVTKEVTSSVQNYQ